MKILIAEDNMIIAKTLELCLQKDGYQIICSFDGLEAMEKIQTENPDLIIVDVNLPYCSGLEVLRKVKENDACIPVIVISAEGQQKVVEKAMQFGADGFIAKPFNLTVLTSKIDRLLLRAATA